ncbi:MAG TPA: hypothetical protein VHV51_18150 [Polyangiaceae bacterium]|jgi:hypothetical protein|nr:hypothetical protein [Polyangiaceae bacterium]
MSSANCFRRVWLVRLSTFVACVISLGWASSAFAAAPMCGVHAQTVAAPPIGTPASDDTVNADNPCSTNEPLRAAGIPNRDAPEKLSFPDSPLRALPISVQLAPAPLTGRSSTATPEHDLCATGFARSIDRPPRS